MLLFCRSAEVSVGDSKYTIEPNMVKVKRYQKKEHGQ
jgi:hypothetical protein